MQSGREGIWSDISEQWQDPSVEVWFNIMLLTQQLIPINYIK